MKKNLLLILLITCATIGYTQKNTLSNDSLVISTYDLVLVYTIASDSERELFFKIPLPAKRQVSVGSQFKAGNNTSKNPPDF